MRSPRAAAARQPVAEREFSAGQMESVSGADVIRGGLRQQRESLLGDEPSGDESADRSASWPEHHARDRHARPRNGQPHKRFVPVGSGHQEDDLHVSDAQRRAPLWHGVRRHGQATACRTRFLRAVLRSPAAGRRAGARGQSAGRIQDHHDPVRSVAKPRQRRPDHDQPAWDHCLPVQRQVAHVDAVQWRCADNVSMGHIAGPVVCRPAQLE